MDRIQVIYVFGSGHSGSTLAGLLLGAHSRIECVGEVKQYERSAKRDRACNCGRPIPDCGYWQEVHRLAGFNPALETPAVNAIEQERFGRINTAFIRAVLKHTGKEVFCDTSKTKKRLHKYLSCPEFEVTVLHLVRDGRAVAFSNQRKGRVFRRYCHRWNKRNMREKHALFESGLAPDRYHCIRYEDLVANPQETLSLFQETLGLDFEGGQMDRWGAGNHHIGGNHMARKNEGRIRLDTAYLDSLGTLQWIVATGLQARALKAYGYAFSRRGMERQLGRT